MADQREHGVCWRNGLLGCSSAKTIAKAHTMRIVGVRRNEIFDRVCFSARVSIFVVKWRFQ